MKSDTGAFKCKPEGNGSYTKLTTCRQRLNSAHCTRVTIPVNADCHARWFRLLNEIVLEIGDTLSNLFYQWDNL